MLSPTSPTLYKKIQITRNINLKETTEQKNKNYVGHMESLKEPFSKYCYNIKNRPSNT